MTATKTDVLRRRLRHAAPQPVDDRIELRERDYAIFEALHRHGPLPSNYLFEFTRQLGSDFNNLQKRLTKLYNGVRQGAAFLTRPPQQFACFEARYQPLIYDLAPLTKRLLAERGRLSPYLPDRKDHFLHRAMTAAAGASFELTAKRLRIRYIGKDEIFAHPKCPDTTRLSSNPLAIPLTTYGRKFVVPDDLFGFEYPERGFRFFAVEIDRNTEGIERNSPGNNFGRKIEGYFDVLRNRTFGMHWGIPNLTVLTVTTSAKHMQNLLAHLRKQDDQICAEKFLFQADPHFGVDWRVPRTLLDDLVRGVWMTPARIVDIGKP